MSLSIVPSLHFWIIALIILAAGGIVMMFAVVFAIFYNTMYRSPKKKARECTNKKDAQQMMMFEKGIAWASQYRDKTTELKLENDGLNLYGEYIDFGYKKCAVILQGRTESLLYSYYFAEVYRKNGYNILVVDVRAHGLSDGNYQTGGVLESDDIVLWIKRINKTYGIGAFTIHGICVGGATAVYTYIKLKNEGIDLVKSIVTDGMFISYYEMFRQNFKMRKKPIFPILQMVFFLGFLLTGVRFFRETPLRYMKDIDIPILFIWSEKDIFNKKEKCMALYDACASEKKELRFFPEGRHSHVRSTQEEDYDEAIQTFIIKNKEE